MRKFVRDLLRKAGRHLNQGVVHELTLLRAATLYQTLPERVLTIVHGGVPVKFYLPDGPVDFNQERLLLKLDFQEAAVLRVIRARFGLRGARVIDIGANMGDHTLYYAMICKAASVIAFEPNPRARDILERNLALNGVSTVMIEPVGLSNEDGTLGDRGVATNHIGGMSYAPQADGAIVARRLDSYSFEGVDFIKIDVEGMTALVLEGAWQTLRTHKPPMMVEIFPAEMAACTALLAELGYRRTRSFGADNYLYEI